MKKPYKYVILRRRTKNPKQQFHVQIVASNGEVVYRGEKKARKGDIVRIARKENANRITPYPIIDLTGKEEKELAPLSAKKPSLVVTRVV
jgi:hypothetical protein